MQLKWFGHLVKSSESSDKVKQRLIKKIDKLSEKRGINDVGYMKHFFVDAKDDKKQHHIKCIVGLCTSDRDLTGDFIAVRSVAKNPDAEMVVIRRFVGIYLSFVKRAFSQVIAEEKQLAESLRDIIGQPVAPCLLTGLKVDEATTTLYLHESLDKRLGVFINFV
jgi:hypothetical protein